MKPAPITKKHLYYLITFIAVFIGITYAIAQTSAPNPGHIADEIGEGTIANTLTITNSNVGIGTTNPAEKLHVTGGNLAIGETSGGTTRALKFFDGTATTFSSIINPSSAGLRFLTNNGNTDAMSILSNGNVGIGTTNPGEMLDVNGNIRAKSTGHSSLYIDAGANKFPQFVFAVNGVNKWNIYSDYANSDILRITNPATAVTVMALQQNGNVGIGTASPAKNLHIAGGAGTGIRLEDTGFQNWDIVATHSANAGRLDILRSDGTTNVLSIVEVSGGGNVGIGTVNPNSKLQIGTPGAAGREYLQIDMESNAPLSTDCDAQNEGGRMVYDDSNKRIWVCDGQLGWRYASTIQ